MIGSELIFVIACSYIDRAHLLHHFTFLFFDPLVSCQASALEVDVENYQIAQKDKRYDIQDACYDQHNTELDEESFAIRSFVGFNDVASPREEVNKHGYICDVVCQAH